MRQRQEIFTKNIAKLIFWIFENGYTVTLGEAYRPQEMQEIYFKQGKSKTLKSKHSERLAVDLNMFIRGKLLLSSEEIKPIGDYWIILDKNNRWGGDWNKNGIINDQNFYDPFHFEMVN